MKATNSSAGPSLRTSNTRADNFIKLKPRTCTGPDEDFEDFLTQFEITAEINGWNYRSKSLYLANCLTGAARALLNELNDIQRREYQCLVQSLRSVMVQKTVPKYSVHNLKARDKREMGDNCRTCTSY